jgi:glutathione peroxidase
MFSLAKLAIVLAVALPVSATVKAEGVHGLSFRAIDGGALALEHYAGQPLLLVNTASRCGFTDQYADLQDVWERYRVAGLVVVGMPSGDFDQELADAAAIQEFCEVNFGIDFPMTDKLATRGPDRHPFFRAVEEDLGAAALPRWNFHKYLVDREGRVVEAWPSNVRPTDAAVQAAIERALRG